jgi:hypothetical protein
MSRRIRRLVAAPTLKTKTHGPGAFGAQRGAKRYLGHSEPARKGRARSKCFATEEDRRPVSRPLQGPVFGHCHDGRRSPRGTSTMPGREWLASINLHPVSLGVDKFSAELDLVDRCSFTRGGRSSSHPLCESRPEIISKPGPNRIPSQPLGIP